MNGIHDLGGMHGHGPVDPEANAQAFHAPWQPRVMALGDAMAPWCSWSVDRSRYIREILPPADYLAQDYFAQWLRCFIRLYLEDGLVSEAELATGRPDPGEPKRAPKIRPEQAGSVAGLEDPARRESEAPARFAPGDAVVAINHHPTGHTRLPRYARGRAGIVDRVHGVFVFADSNAHGQGERPQHVYSVRFAARDLWGPSAAAGRGGPSGHSVYLDLWEAHLVRA
jgi:nitrile hydratase